MSTKPLAINADAGAPEYAAIDQRRNQAMLLTQGVGDGLGARAGVRPGGSPAITLAGQTISIHPRPVTVYPAQSSTDGPYIGYLEDDTHTLDPADGSNDRIDIVVVRVYDDDHDASGRRELVTEYIAGTPAGDPDPPAAPAGTFVGAEMTVFAGGSPAPTLEYVAPFTVAAGGVLPVRDDAEGPDAGQYHGMLRYRQDTDQLEVWDGSDWTPISGVGGWETVVNTTISGTTDIPVPSGVFDMVRVHLRGRLDAEARVTMRINDDGTANLHRAAWAAYRLDTGAVAASNSNDTTVWSIAQWSTGSNNTAEATIFNTDVSTNLSFQGSGFRAASSTALRERTLSGGDLASPRLLSSLRFSASGSDNIDTCEVVIEGHRA